MSANLKRFHIGILIAAIVLYTITAINSQGFHHFDEHYQILEFAGLKLGINKPADLAWEYDWKIRPALQPAIAVVLITAFKKAGIQSPFEWAEIIRFLTAMFVLACIYFSVNELSKMIKEENKKLFIILSYFLYFIPYIATRFSSETMSGALFLLGFTVIIKNRDNGKLDKPAIIFLAGLLFGLSFICRFQAAFLIVGLLCWLIWIYKLPARQIALLMAGIALVTALGVCIDYWFYQAWVFTPFAYFDTNLLQDKAKTFGVEPWYYYAVQLTGGDVKSALKIIILCCTIGFLLVNRKNIITLTICPFIIIHCLIGHKEMRFMIPIAFFIPTLIIFSLEYIKLQINDIRLIQFGKLVIFQALFINAIALTANILKPADGLPLVYEYLYDNYKGISMHIYFYNEGRNFYHAQGVLPMNFYKCREHVLKPIDCEALNNLAGSTGRNNALVIADGETDMNGLPVTPVFHILPAWFQKLNKSDWMKLKNANWVIYKVTPTYAAL